MSSACSFFSTPTLLRAHPGEPSALGWGGHACLDGPGSLLGRGRVDSLLITGHGGGAAGCAHTPGWEVKTAPPAPSLGSGQILVPAEAWGGVVVVVTEPTSTDLWGRLPGQVWREVGVRWHLYGRTCASLVAG